MMLFMAVEAAKLYLYLPRWFLKVQIKRHWQRAPLYEKGLIICTQIVLFSNDKYTLLWRPYLLTRETHQRNIIGDVISFVQPHWCSKQPLPVLLLGNLDYFTGSFDIGVSVHACGVATDLVLKMCLDNRADFVSCPCCYGKVQENHVLSYPRSQMFAAKEPTFEVSDNYQSFFIRNCVISRLPKSGECNISFIYA